MTDPTSPSHRATELIRTHAERQALEEQERAQERRRALAELRSSLNSPDVRIRVWEKMHALRLPGDPAHPVLAVIAMATGLTIAQVREEQSARVARRAVSTQQQEHGR